jgi:hypothetical protein
VFFAGFAVRILENSPRRNEAREGFLFPGVLRGFAVRILVVFETITVLENIASKNDSPLTLTGL